MADELPIPANFQAGGLNRSYTTIFRDLVKLARHYLPEWTYMGDDDLGVALMQLFSYLGDHLHYRADSVTRDLRLAKTPHRFMAAELAQMLGYFAKRATPAEATVTFTLPSSKGDDLTIPRWTQLKASLEETIHFETTEDLVIAAGETTGSVSVIEGQRREDVTIGTASGTPFESFVISDTDVVFNWVDGEIEVTVNGNNAVHVKWPMLASPAQLAFWVRPLRDGRLSVRFGDGTYGSLLPVDGVVRATYRRGGGIRGRVGVGDIDTIIDQILLDGSPVSLSVTNAARSSGGLDAEGVDEIRRNAPAAFRTQMRYVTKDDYESGAQDVPGVFRARVVASGVNGVLVYVVPDGAKEDATLTDALKQRIRDQLNSQKMATDFIAVDAADLIPIDVTLNIRAFQNYRNADVRQRVRDVFTGEGGILHMNTGELGVKLWLSDMIGAIESVVGVDNLDVIRYARRPGIYWITKSGDAAFVENAAGTYVETGANTREQTWKITFINATNFTVVGSVSGRQQSQGELGEPYGDDGGEISFQINAGDSPMAENDQVEIRVSRDAWNIELGPNEFPVAGVIAPNVSGGLE